VWWQAPLAQRDSDWAPAADGGSAAGEGGRVASGEVAADEQAVDLAGQGDATRDEPAPAPAGQEGAAPANGQAGAVPSDSDSGSGPQQGPGEPSFPPAPPAPAGGRPLPQTGP
jgi:hypothetical protein